MTHGKQLTPCELPPHTLLRTIHRQGNATCCSPPEPLQCESTGHLPNRLWRPSGKWAPRWLRALPEALERTPHCSSWGEGGRGGAAASVAALQVLDEALCHGAKPARGLPGNVLDLRKVLPRLRSQQRARRCCCCCLEGQRPASSSAQSRHLSGTTHWCGGVRQWRQVVCGTIRPMLA